MSRGKKSKHAHLNSTDKHLFSLKKSNLLKSNFSNLSSAKWEAAVEHDRRYNREHQEMKTIFDYSPHKHCLKFDVSVRLLQVSANLNISCEFSVVLRCLCMLMISLIFKAVLII